MTGFEGSVSHSVPGALLGIWVSSLLWPRLVEKLSRRILGENILLATQLHRELPFSGPLIASIVALIGEARGSLDPATIESLLVSHSDPQLYHDGTSFCPTLPQLPSRAAVWRVLRRCLFYNAC